MKGSFAVSGYDSDNEVANNKRKERMREEEEARGAAIRPEEGRARVPEFRRKVRVRSRSHASDVSLRENERRRRRTGIPQLPREEGSASRTGSPGSRVDA
jgi:hypothetical protein